jgi:hypothetical protein
MSGMRDMVRRLEESGAVFLPPPSARALELANAALQQMKASVLPAAAAGFYKAHGGALLGDACVFPADDADRPDRRYVFPSLVGINRDLTGLSGLRGKTVWGRNQFYWFSADVAGKILMHDILTLSVLRDYADFGAAITDCLLVGKL